MVLLCTLLAACSFDPGGGLPADPMSPSTADAGQPGITPTQMYAGNQTELWLLDRDTLETTLIGEFSGFVDTRSFSCGGIALATDGTLYAVSVAAPSTLYTVDPATAALSKPVQLNNADDVWGTTMVPSDTTDSFTGKDTLILGGPNGDLYAVKPGGGGMATLIGSFPDNWRVSGDLAWVDGVGLMGTLDDGMGSPDQLATISLTDASVTMVGDTGRGNVYGLASVGGQLWGLTGDNLIYEMNTANADEMTTMQGPTNWSIAAP